jgi:hypothetical protein
LDAAAQANYFAENLQIETCKIFQFILNLKCI